MFEHLSRHPLVLAFAVLLAIIVVGVNAFEWIEGWGWSDAAWIVLAQRDPDSRVMGVTNWGAACEG